MTDSSKSSATSGRFRLFNCLAYNPASSEFVQSGELAIWLCSQNQRDDEFVATVDELIQCFMVDFVGIPKSAQEEGKKIKIRLSGMASLLSSALKEMIISSLKVATENDYVQKRVRPGRTIKNFEYLLLPSGAKLSKDLSMPEQFRNDLLLCLLRSVTEKLKTPNQNRAKRALQAIAIGENQSETSSEILKAISATSKSTEVIKNLCPFVFEVKINKDESRFYLTGIGEVLWEIIRKHFFRDEGAEDSSLKESTLSELEQFWLIAADCAAEPRPKSRALYSSAVALIVGHTEWPTSKVSIWDELLIHLKEEHQTTVYQLVSSKLLTCFSQENGEVLDEFPLDTPCYLELSDLGKEEVKNCQIDTELAKALLEEFRDVAIRAMEESKFKSLRGVLIFANIRTTVKKPFTIQELFEHQKKGNLNEAIQFLQPLIVPDNDKIQQNRHFKTSTLCGLVLNKLG